MTRQFAYDRTVTTIQRARGQLRKQNVAVALNSAAVSAGQQGWSAADLSRMEALLRGGLGIDEARGDKLVVSAMPAAIYRSIMKALDAWDYLQKTTFDEAEFVETFLDILRSARSQKGAEPVAAADDELSLDPLWQRSPTWRGQRINLPLTAQRILNLREELVHFEHRNRRLRRN